jgi:hypothetical protein
MKDTSKEKQPDHEKIIRKGKGDYIRLYPERWIHGSTREELTNAERAVWIDLLALAGLNDPPGQIIFFTRKRLANTLNISEKLLNSTLNKAIYFRKIDIKPDQIEVKSTTKITTLGTSQSKIGSELHTIYILKWDEYQSEYMRQKPYRTGEKENDRPDNEETGDSE